MKSAIVKRSIAVGDRKTSVSVEDAFWWALKEIAVTQRVPVKTIVAEIDGVRGHGNLSSAIRLFVLDQVKVRVQAKSTEHIAQGPSAVHLPVDQIDLKN